ncbi:MAG: MurR/RpiR family transcriptional regulator [Anaerolineae bacterium]
MTEHSVKENILTQFESLSPKQRQLARFILDNEDMVAFASANEVGERVGASAATVVRFCRALGYEGYTDLQAAIRTQFPQYRTAVEKMAAQMAGDTPPDNLTTRVAQITTQNIQDTMSQVDDDTLAAAVAAIAQARHIRIFGSGLSAAAAILAEHSLSSLGFSARACSHGRANQSLELAQLTDRDLVIVISMWRYLRDTVEAAQAARQVGATCLALTDSPVAPLAQLADFVFIAATEGAVHSRSLSGIIAFIELISATLVSSRPNESMAALQRLDALYRQNNLLLSD